MQCKISGNNNVDNKVKEAKRMSFSKTGQEMYCTYNIIIGHIHITTAAVEKIISTAYSKCVFVAFIIQHAKHKCLIILSPAACLALP